MKSNMTISSYAFKTIEALKCDSVIKVYPAAIHLIEAALKSHNKGYFVGVKNTDAIPHLFLSQLQSKGFIIHTLDVMSYGGRAIDIKLTNPITGKFMTGSSSGTAINVFKGINDLGIGTDGGGSVLNPALSLNLYAVISKIYQQESMRKLSKVSTDGIQFSPCIGFISKDLEIIEEVVLSLTQDHATKDYEIINGLSNKHVHKSLHQNLKDSGILFSQTINLSYDSLNRKKMIDELKTIDLENKVLLLSEGPIDLLAYGDTLMGHLGEINSNLQELGHKYYSKVINMLGLSAMVIPTNTHAVGFLLVTQSTENGLVQLIDVAKKFEVYESKLVDKYFDLNEQYLKEGFE